MKYKPNNFLPNAGKVERQEVMIEKKTGLPGKFKVPHVIIPKLKVRGIHGNRRGNIR